MIQILLDNGHGVETPGKSSPDKSIREYEYTRTIVALISEKLTAEHISYHILVPELSDVPLKERCVRANRFHIQARANGDTTALISVHLNAASTSGWSSARGFSDWVCNTASADSRELGRLLYEEAEKRGLKGNRSVPTSKNWESNFYILKNTNMPAVLTENLFQDNHDDVNFLLTEEGQQAIVDLHVEAIKRYIASHPNK